MSFYDKIRHLNSRSPKRHIFMIRSLWPSVKIFMNICRVLLAPNPVLNGIFPSIFQWIDNMAYIWVLFITSILFIYILSYRYTRWLSIYIRRCFGCAYKQICIEYFLSYPHRRMVHFKQFVRASSIKIGLIHRGPLEWRHNERDGVSNHRRLVCLLNRLFRCTSKKTSKLRVTGLCEGNSPVVGGCLHKGPVTRKMFPFNDVIMRSKGHHAQIGSMPTKPPYWLNTDHAPICGTTMLQQ